MSAFAYLIATHAQPLGTIRFARTLSSETESNVFIHADPGGEPFPRERLAGDSRIRFVEPAVRGRWGMYSLVEQALTSLRFIYAVAPHTQWVVYVSGQHYAARPPAELEAMLAGSDSDAFIAFKPVGPHDTHLQERYRFAYRFWPGPQLPFPLNRVRVQRGVNAVQPLVRVQSNPRASSIGLRTQTSIFDMVPQVYKGSQWWALSRTAIEHVFETLARRPHIAAAYRQTLIPDESLFQTLVANAPNLRVVNTLLHCALWDSRTGTPRTLGASDLPEILESEKWFARKIDDRSDGGLRDLLDARRARVSVA